LRIKICVSLPPKSVDEAIELIGEAETEQADFIEVRLDYLNKYDHIIEIPSCSKIPLIATNKSIACDGNFSGSETEQQKVLIDAARSGFEYVDVDLRTPKQTELISTLHQMGVKVIVSFHDFEKTPGIRQLNKVLEEEIELGADVCKIITTARSNKDNLRILDFVSEASRKVKLVCFAMGDLGKHSRLVSPIFGAFFTFASLNEKRKTAKGQLTIKEMNNAYKALGLI
jgi:3-dehydroquinate dehydratase-1